MILGPGLGEALAQVSAYLHTVLHPVSTLLLMLGIKAPGDVDIALWAIVTWLLGSRESEAVRRLGIVLVAAIAAVALLEYFLAAPG